MYLQFIGQFLINKGCITKQQLEEALRYQSEHDPKIGEIAVTCGYLSVEVAETINREQRRIDKLFGEIAVEKKVLTQDQVDEITAIQKKNHIYIGDALIKLNFLSKETFEQLFDQYNQEFPSVASVDSLLPPEVSNHSEVKSILDITEKIFKRIADLRIKFGKGTLISQSIEVKDLGAKIVFEGTKEFMYFINCSKNVKIQIAEALYGRSSQDMEDSEMSDCLGELCNTICGISIPVFADLGFAVKVTPPEFYYKEKNCDFPFEKDPSWAVSFPSMVPEGPLDVILCSY